MLVVVFLMLGALGMICNMKRRDSIFLIAGLVLFVLGVLIQVNAPDEKKLVDQKALMGSVIDPEVYVLFSEEENTAICRYEDTNDRGWTEQKLKDCQIIQEVGCSNPRLECYKDKIIGVIKVSFSRKEEIRLYIPVNAIENM